MTVCLRSQDQCFLWVRLEEYENHSIIEDSKAQAGVSNLRNCSPLFPGCLGLLHHTPYFSSGIAGSQGVAVHPRLDFLNWYVSLHEEFLSSPHHRAQSVQKTSRDLRMSFGYQWYLPLLECILLWSLKESFILHQDKCFINAALIRTVEHPWGPAWLSFRPAGAELIPSKQRCICAAALWCVLLFFPFL